MWGRLPVTVAPRAGALHPGAPHFAIGFKLGPGTRSFEACTNGVTTRAPARVGSGPRPGPPGQATDISSRLCYLLDAEEGGSAVFIPAAAKKESQTFHIQAFIIIMVAPPRRCRLSRGLRADLARRREQSSETYYYYGRRSCQ